MASIEIGKFSQKSKQRLCHRVEPSGLGLEALVRPISDEAASEAPARSWRFPHDLIGVVGSGEDIETHLRTHAPSQLPVEL